MIKSKYLLILLFLCLLVYGISSLRRLNDADETRYTEIPREMMEAGNYTVPTLNYVPYFEKPVFTYWLTAASFKLFGITPLSSRLWVILFSLIGVIITYYFSLSIKRSPETALLSAMILATSLGYGVLSTILITDMIFSVFLWIAIFAFWNVYKNGNAGKWKIIFWSALALALLTKGPLSLIIVFGSLCLFSLFNKKIDWVRKLDIKMGVVLFLIIVLPWHIVVFLKNPGFLEFFYIQQNFLAFFDGNVHHTQNRFYYWVCLFFGLYPWFVIFCGAVYSAIQKLFSKQEIIREENRLFWATGIFVFAFFSIASSKLAAYILPAFPPMAILMSHYIEENKNSKLLRYGFLIQSLLLIGIICAMILDRRDLVLSYDKEILSGFIFALVLFFGVMMISSYKALKGAVKSAVIIQAVLMFFMIPAVMYAYAFITPHKTLETILKTIPSENFKKDDKVISVYSNAYSVLLFFKKPMVLLERALELGFGYYILENPEGKDVLKNHYEISGKNFKSSNLLDYASLPEIWNQDQRIWLFTSGRKKNKIQKIDELNLKYYKIASDKDNLLISNKPLIERSKS